MTAHTPRDPQLDSTLDPRRQAIRAAELTRSGGTNDRSLYLECKAELERVKAERDELSAACRRWLNTRTDNDFIAMAAAIRKSERSGQ